MLQHIPKKMTKTNRHIFHTALILIASAIILGAFAAHGLKGKITDAKLASYEVAVRYQMYMGIALLALLAAQSLFSLRLKTPFRLILIGTLCFSGSIYILCFQAFIPINLTPFIAPITPIGGSLMFIGWLLILIQSIRSKSPKEA